MKKVFCCTIRILLFLQMAFFQVTAIADGPGPVVDPASPSAIGGAFSSLMSESYQTNLATGAATLTVPIVVPPGRKNIQPNLALSYSSTNGNGVCGMGWALPATSIQRSTKQGVPRYDSMQDIMVGSDELVCTNDTAPDYMEYHAKIESSFTIYRYYENANEWVAIDKSGNKFIFGASSTSRMSNPENEDQVFAWYLDNVSDVYGNTMTYTYEEDGNSLYIRYIEYTSNANCNPQLRADKRIEFVYDAAERTDKIYNRRTGWPCTIAKLLKNIRVIVDENKDGAWSSGEIVWRYNLQYTISGDTGRSLLTSIQLEDGSGNTLPARIFRYQELEP